MVGTGSGGGEPQSFTPTLHPSSPQQEMVPEFPCTFFPPTPAPTPPRPPPGPATLASPRPLIVPKAERLSPPALSGKQGLQELGDSRGGREKEESETMSGASMRGTEQGPSPLCWSVCGSVYPCHRWRAAAVWGAQLHARLGDSECPSLFPSTRSKPEPSGQGGTIPLPQDVFATPKPSHTLSYAHPTFCPPRLRTVASPTSLQSRSGASISSWGLTPCMGW